jgi:hypothetical protein
MKKELQSAFVFIFIGAWLMGYEMAKSAIAEDYSFSWFFAAAVTTCFVLAYKALTAFKKIQ